VEGKQHADRNAQFEHLDTQAMECLKRGVPFISVDTKKQELVGNFKNGGRESRPLCSYETVVNLIGNTTARGERLDQRGDTSPDSVHDTVLQGLRDLPAVDGADDIDAILAVVEVAE